MREARPRAGEARPRHHRGLHRRGPQAESEGLQGGAARYGKEGGRDTFALLSLAFAQIFIVTQVSANAYHDGNIKMDFVRY